MEGKVHRSAAFRFFLMLYYLFAYAIVDSCLSRGYNQVLRQRFVGMFFFEMFFHRATSSN